MLFRKYLEEISICVRFVHTREDNKKVQVRQEFLGFAQAESRTGASREVSRDAAGIWPGYGQQGYGRRGLSVMGGQTWQGSRTRRSLYMSIVRLTP